MVTETYNRKMANLSNFKVRLYRKSLQLIVCHIKYQIISKLSIYKFKKKNICEEPKTKEIKKSVFIETSDNFRKMIFQIF